MHTSTVSRIAIVGPLPPPFGGMANQTEQLARLLEVEGITVNLIRNNAPYRPQWIEHVKGVRAFFRLVPYLFELWSRIKNAEVVHVMANSGWSWYLFAAPPILVARLLDRPTVVNYRGGEAEEFLVRGIRWVRPVMNRADRIVVPSGYLKEVFSKFGIQTEIVPNIIDIDRFKPASEGDIGNGTRQLISCRNLEAIYDIETTLKAFREINSVLPDTHLTIAGEGPEKERLLSLAVQLGIASEVTFAGRLDTRGMAALYQSADLLINTSRVDNMPNALLEAMAAGVPIVTTNAGGIPFIVEDQVNGFLVPVGDWKKVSESALILLEDSALCQKFTDNAFSLVEKFSWKAVKGSWIRVYEELLAS